MWLEAFAEGVAEGKAIPPASTRTSHHSKLSEEDLYSEEEIVISPEIQKAPELADEEKPIVKSRLILKQIGTTRVPSSSQNSFLPCRFLDFKHLSSSDLENEVSCPSWVHLILL